MAKIVEDVLVIKFSRIVKNDDSDPEPACTADNAKAIVQVAQELVGESIVVEMEYV
jgi:hypothetical protein